MQGALMLPIASCVYSLHASQLRGDCIFFFFVCKFWSTQGIHGFWKAAPSTSDKATETYLWPLGSKLVHTQCLGGSDSNLLSTHPPQPFARTLHAEIREAAAVSLSELETRAFPRGARSL